MFFCYGSKTQIKMSIESWNKATAFMPRKSIDVFMCPNTGVKEKQKRMPNIFFCFLLPLTASEKIYKKVWFYLSLKGKSKSF